MVAVACALAAEVVTLHSTCETFTAADRGDVDLLACCEEICANFLSNFEAIY
jgi:hypothetical protein